MFTAREKACLDFTVKYVATPTRSPTKFRSLREELEKYSEPLKRRRYGTIPVTGLECGESFEIFNHFPIHEHTGSCLSVSDYGLNEGKSAWESVQKSRHQAGIQ